MTDLAVLANDVRTLPDLLSMIYGEGGDPELAARAAKAVRQELGTEPDLSKPFPVPAVHPEWWYDPAPNTIPPGRKATYLPDGRVYGRFFEWDECIASDNETCWKVQPDPTGYLNFHQSDVDVMSESGEKKMIACGGLVAGHADPWASMEDAIEHYNNPDAMVVLCRAYEDDFGGYIVGGIRPGATWAQALAVKHAPLSGHWEECLNVQTANGDRLRRAWVCLGPSMVVRPGFPLHSADRAVLGMVTKGTTGLKRVATMTTAAAHTEQVDVGEETEPETDPTTEPETVTETEPETTEQEQPATEAATEAPATGPATEAPESQELPPIDALEAFAREMVGIRDIMNRFDEALSVLPQALERLDDLEAIVALGNEIVAPSLMALPEDEEQNED